MEGIEFILKRMRDSFDITDEEAKAVEYILDSEFKMNEFSEFLKNHSDISPQSFTMGFFACILTCMELDTENDWY